MVDVFITGIYRQSTFTEDFPSNVQARNPNRENSNALRIHNDHSEVNKSEIFSLRPVMARKNKILLFPKFYVAMVNTGRIAHFTSYGLHLAFSEKNPRSRTLLSSMLVTNKVNITTPL